MVGACKGQFAAAIRQISQIVERSRLLILITKLIGESQALGEPRLCIHIASVNGSQVASSEVGTDSLEQQRARLGMCQQLTQPGNPFGVVAVQMPPLPDSCGEL